MESNEKISTIRFEIYSTLLYSILFLAILSLLFAGMFYTKLFGVVAGSTLGYLYITILGIMLINTLIEIIHINKMYKYIKNKNIKKLMEINKIAYAIFGVFFSGLITGLLLIFIRDSINNL